MSELCCQYTNSPVGFLHDQESHYSITEVS